MAEQKGASIPPKLTEAEQDLLRHLEHGHQLETDTLGGNPLFRHLKDDGTVRPLSVSRNTVKALEEHGRISSVQGHEPLTRVWRSRKKTK